MSDLPALEPILAPGSVVERAIGWSCGCVTWLEAAKDGRRAWFVKACPDRSACSVTEATRRVAREAGIPVVVLEPLQERGS